MALNDVKIVRSPYGSLTTETFVVEDRTTSSDTVMYAGEPVKIQGAGSNYVIHLATGDPEIGTDIVAGITQAGSTETSSADGTVEVVPASLPGLVYRCKAQTGSNLAAGVLYDTVAFDYASTTYTIDENEGTDEDVHGLRMLTYDAVADTVDFIIKPAATMSDCSL